MRCIKLLVLVGALILGAVVTVAGLALRTFGQAVSLVLRSGADVDFPFATSWDDSLLVIGTALFACGAGGLVLTGRERTASLRGIATEDRSLGAWLLAEEQFLVLVGSAAGDSVGQLAGSCLVAEEKAASARKPVMALLAESDSPGLLKAFARWTVARRALDEHLLSGETGQEFVNALNAANAALEDIRRHSTSL